MPLVKTPSCWWCVFYFTLSHRSSLYVPCRAQRPLMVVKLILGFVLKMAVFWPWLARELFFSHALEQSTLKRWVSDGYHLLMSDTRLVWQCWTIVAAGCGCNAILSLSFLFRWIRYLSHFRDDSKNTLDLLDLRDKLPSKKADTDGRASWARRAPPRFGGGRYFIFFTKEACQLCDWHMLFVFPPPSTALPITWWLLDGCSMMTFRWM